MTPVKLLLILSLFSIIPGQIIRIPLSASGALTISDIIVSATLTVGVFYLLTFKKSLKLDLPIFIPALVFSLVAAASTTLALDSFSAGEVAVSSMFLARFIAYFAISQIVPNLIKKEEVTGWLRVLLVVGTGFALLGFGQIMIFPNLSFLAAYGWDPHEARLTSTFLDPNFAGGLMTLFFALSLSFFASEKKALYLLFSVVAFAAIILTFSRSSYLAAASVLIVIGVLKSKKVLVTFLILFMSSFLLLAQVRDRIAGALAFDETSKARVESWQRAAKVAAENPVLGVGFNTYRFAQAKAGFFSFDNPQGGHSGGGSDSSILLVAATTGIIGLIAYLILLLKIMFAFLKKARESALHLGALSALVGLVLHSQFVNSLFFPQIMLPFWFIVGLVSVKSQAKTND
ncbi:O-antigen ligase family protein [Candidatus Curtissbacteria bacterium]|nr:O-antigen ligase family protein [Candidatus Curtissbacteria bacterium]